MRRPAVHDHSSFLTVFSHFTFRRQGQNIGLAQRRGGKAILMVHPRYPNDPSFSDYCMQFLILHKPFRQWEHITLGFDSPVEAYNAFIAANPHLVRHRQQLENAVQQAAAE